MRPVGSQQRRARNRIRTHNLGTIQRRRYRQTLVMVLQVGKLQMQEQGARVDEMEAQRARAPKLVNRLLHQPLRPKTGDWVYYRQCLPSEYPAGHREAYRRIAQMHDFHTHLPNPARSFSPVRGGTTSSLSETIATVFTAG